MYFSYFALRATARLVLDILGGFAVSNGVHQLERTFFASSKSFISSICLTSALTRATTLLTACGMRGLRNSA